MRIDGEWALFDDGVIRPIVFGEISAADGSWVKCPFLVDTGADRTVLTVLGRDITGLFAVIVDETRRVVCMVSQRHHYTIQVD